MALCSFLILGNLKLIRLLYSLQEAKREQLNTPKFTKIELSKNSTLTKFRFILLYSHVESEKY